MNSNEIGLRFATLEEEERERAFTVIKNYVCSVAMYLRDQYGGDDRLGEALVRKQEDLTGYRKLRARPIGGEVGETISRYLTISWASELQLRLGASGDRATLRYANVWAPVHAYYAVYMSMQAWFALNGMSLVEDHSASLRAIANDVASRQLLPLPWSVTCSGGPQANEVTFSRVPSGEDPGAAVELLSRPAPHTFWPRYCKMLETTRRRRLDRNFAEWKKRNGRKAIRAQEQRTVAGNLLPTTFFDFLWRLRIRSNYRDVSSFLTWNVTDGEHTELSDSTALMTDATCTLLQSLLVKAGCGSLYRRLADGFVDSSNPDLGGVLTFVERRRRLLVS